HFASALLGIDQIRNSYRLKSAFVNPIETGQTGVERSVLDVACHLLRSNQHAFNFGIAGGRKIRTRVGVDRQSSLSEELQRGFLQASFGNPEPDFHRALSATLSVAGRAIPFVKHERVPS